MAIAFAAVGVLAVALLTKATEPTARAPIIVHLPPSPFGFVTASAQPATLAGPFPTTGAPSRNPAATPYPTFATVPAKAGRAQLVLAGPTSIRMSVTLPAGWAKAGDAMYVKPGVVPVPLSIGAWRLQDVNIVPCRWSSQDHADPPLMRSAEGQAEALSSWWGQDPRMPPESNATIAPLASKPQPVTFHGHDAWSVEVLIPSGLDLTECDGDQLVLWDTATGDVRYALGPGEVNRLWVIDVDGGPIVVGAASFVGMSTDDATELQAVVDSVTIEP